VVYALGAEYFEPLTHVLQESDVRSVALRVPHGLPRLPPAGAGDGEPLAELGRFHLRSADRGPDRVLGLPDRRDRGADPLLPRSVVGELLGLGRVRSAYPLAPRPLPSAPARRVALAGLRQPPRAIHAAPAGSDGASCGRRHSPVRSRRRTLSRVAH